MKSVRPPAPTAGWAAGSSPTWPTAASPRSRETACTASIAARRAASRCTCPTRSTRADRATTPLLREHASERWRPATWRRALPLLAKRLRAIVEQHGPDAIAFYISGQLLTEDYYAVNKLVKGFIGTNNVDSNSRLCMSSAVAAYRERSAPTARPPATPTSTSADCMLLLGTNTAAAIRSSGRGSGAGSRRERR